MNNDTKQALAISLLGASLIGGFIYLDAKTSKKENEKAKEREEKYTQRNAAIDVEMKNKSSFSVGDLINSVITSTEISSSIKNAIVTSIKNGRNKLDDTATKQIYRVANNGFVEDEDKKSIIDAICDGHVKTKEELEHEAKVAEAFYEYKKFKESEETKRDKIKYEYWENNERQKTSLKKTQMIADSVKSVFNEPSSNTNSESKTEEKHNK